MKRFIIIFLFLILIINIFSYVYIENTQLYPGEDIKIRGYEEKDILLKVYNVIDPMDIFYHEKRIDELKKELLYSKKIEFKNNTYYEKIKNEGVYLLELEGKETTYYNIVIVKSIDFISIYDGQNLKIKIIDLKKENVDNTYIFLIDNNNQIYKYTDVYELNIKIYNLKKIVAIKNNSYAIKDIYKPYKTYTDNKIVIITDKPIYKPGDTLHVKIHLFKSDENIYSPKKNGKVSLKLKGPSDLELFNEEINTDEFGGGYFDYILNKELPVGYYSLIASFNGEEEYFGFYVQNYIKPDYVISLSSDKEYYFSDEIINYMVQLKYYNEEPVSNAQVAYYIRYYPLNSNNQNLIYQGISFTDKNGKIVLPIKVQNDHNGYYVLQIITIDESQRQMENEISVKVYSGNYLIKTNNYYYQSKIDKEFTVSGSVTDINGNGVSGNIKVELFDELDNIVFSSSIPFETNFNIPLLINKEGSYKIKLSYNDSYTYVYTYTSKHLQEREKINYTIDNNEIKLIDFNGYAFLCGRKLYDEGKILKIPDLILENNIFIVYFYIENHKIIKGIEKIDVGKNRNLKFSIKLSKDVYNPKETVDLEVFSSEDAEYTISVVDESIFGLVDNNFDFEKIVYPELYNPEIIIDTSNKYFFYFSRASLPTSKNILASTKAVNSQKSNTREFFPDTALWLPSIKTKNGYAKISFKNPDTITSFRITINGVSNSRVGTIKENYISTKEFYIRPILPQFAVKGDYIEFPLVAYNNTKNDIKINFNINSDLNIYPKSGVLNVKQNSNNIIKITIKTNNEGEYPIVFDFEKDVVKLNFKVYDDILKRNEKEIIQSKDGSIFDINDVINNNIEELIEYPYYCTEQTVSSVISGVLNSYNGLKLNDFIYRLYKYQNKDGGWGWWSNDKSDTYITSYVLELFYYINNSNIAIDKNIIDKKVIENGLKFLKGEFSKSKYKGYVWYVLKLYNIDIIIEPENDFDLLFLAFFDEDAYNKLKSKIKVLNDLAYLEYNNDYFISHIELNSWLLKLLSKKDEKNLSFKVLKYLLLNKWFSTKDKARVNIALLDFANLKINNMKIIEKEIIDKESIDNGIKIEKTLYKNYPMIVSQENKKYLVDIFMPLNKNFIPEKVKILPINNLEKRGNEYIWLYKGKDEKFQLYNIFIEINKGEMIINRQSYGYPYSLRAINNKIYIHTSKGLFEIISNKKIDENIIDFAILNNSVVVLKNNNLIIGDKVIELSKNIYHVDTLNGEIYLFGDSMYKLSEEKLEYVLPISSSRILDKNIYYGTVKFEGNSISLSSYGKFEITFINGQHNIHLSDIIKTKIHFKSKIPAYLIFEDPIIGASQILTNYNENTIKPSYKFYYNWYDSWNYWYSSYQIKNNKISFFANGYKEGTFDYYWKPTAIGKYKLLHTVGYSMYWSGVYGSSKSIDINIIDN